MITVPEDLRVRLKQYGQEHVLTWWDDLSGDERTDLVEQLRALDLPLLQRLYDRRTERFNPPALERIAPPPMVRLDPKDEHTRSRGENALANGEIAVLMVAGGQGSRLGSDEPKGMFPIGPVSNKSLFQIHAEKVLALSRRYGKSIPLLIMTSPATHSPTTSYFSEHSNFGLPEVEVFFFRQGTMPALDLATGRLILEAPGRLFLSPNGHGGTLTALAETGLLDRLRQRGITQVFYLQVDNPLVKIADPLFLGYHLAAKAEVSSKVVIKNSPFDKLGNLVLIDGRCSMIEYSDLPEELARQKDDSGRLRIRAGSPAIHIFGARFLARVTQGKAILPFHVACKKVPFLDEGGTLIKPDKENALKFELFIFDVLPLAERWTVVETDREDEFVPLKNATGPDSPALVRQALSNQAGAWLECAGVAVPRGEHGDVAVPLEISPLFALDPSELADKLRHQTIKIDEPLYLKNE